MQQVLLVCTGNTCRSSMAAVLLRHLLDKHYPGNGISVSSAGTSATSGTPAASYAIRALREIGLDLEGHSARQVSRALVSQADLVLTMETGHRDYLSRIAPEAKAKLFTLKEYAGEQGDVADPICGDMDTYRATRDELLRLLGRAARNLATK